MKDFVMTLMQAVIIAAVPVVTTYLCQFLRACGDEAKRSIKDENARTLLDEANDAVITAVICTNQTYVDALKKSGQFSAENQREAFQKSYDTAVAIMSQEAKDLIAATYGSLNNWLTAKIEAQVKTEKANI